MAGLRCSRGPGNQGGFGRRKMRILIADDSVIVRERLINLLTELQGVEIIAQAEDAMEARGLAEKLKPDLAILDLRMPKGSGADVLFDLKRLVPSPLVIMLTNYPHAENRKKCMEGGADFFLDKSTEFQKVVSVVKEMLPAKP
jgi:DNA-binding NarL/FixJ family response regulator